MAFVLHKPYPVAEEDQLVGLSFVRLGKPPARALPEAARAFEAMREAAHHDGVSLLIVSGYRSVEQQKVCFADAQRRHGNRAVRWVAPPGYSEHHTGLVFDIGDEGVPATDDEPGFEETPTFHWLSRSGGRFGFELSFPPDNFGRVSYEPWHWRYIGTPKARKVFYPGVFKAGVRWGKAFCRAFSA